jgi:hypothetical protein
VAPSTTARLLVIHAVTVALLVAADRASADVYPYYQTPGDFRELAMAVSPFVVAAALVRSPWRSVGFALGAVTSLIIGLPLLWLAPMSILFAGVAHGAPPEHWYWVPITLMGLLAVVMANFVVSTKAFIGDWQTGRSLASAGAVILLLIVGAWLFFF